MRIDVELKKTNSTLALILLVASIYATTGFFGLYLAGNEFKFATAIWVPSGIALGAVLVWGLRILPGVFLGSLIVNFYLGYQNNNDIPFILNSLVTATIIASGACLQTIVGFFLIKKSIGLNNPLNAPDDILLFTLLSGAVSGLVNATFSNLILLNLNILSAQNLVISWLTWYVGDAIGILIFTPIILILFAKPYLIWRNRIKTVLIPLIISFTILGLIYLIAKNNLLKLNEIEFILTSSLFFSILINITTMIISGQKKFNSIKNE